MKLTGFSLLKRCPTEIVGRIIDSMMLRCLSFDGSSLLMFNSSGLPGIIYDNFLRNSDEEAIVQSFHPDCHLSLIYQAFAGNALPKVATVRTLGGPFASTPNLPHILGSHALPTPKQVVDEAYITLAGPTFSLCYVALRHKGSPGFSDEDVQRIEGIAPKVIEILEHISDLIAASKTAGGEMEKTSPPARRLQRDDEPSGVAAVLPEVTRVDIDEMFKGRLSPRERSSISMTLQGNSVDNIADLLNISPHTVRVHMRNAYAKLRVRNRLELFSLFLRQAGFHRPSEELHVLSKAASN